MIKSSKFTEKLGEAYLVVKQFVAINFPSLGEIQTNINQRRFSSKLVT